MVDGWCLMVCCLCFDDLFVCFWCKSIGPRCPLIGEWCASVEEARSPAVGLSFEVRRTEQEECVLSLSVPLVIGSLSLLMAGTGSMCSIP